MHTLWEARCKQLYVHVEHSSGYLFISLLIEEYVGVEELHQQLDLDRGVHTLLSYPTSFLETLQHSLWVLTLHTNTMVPMIIIRVKREESVEFFHCEINQFHTTVHSSIS